MFIFRYQKGLFVTISSLFLLRRSRVYFQVLFVMQVLIYLFVFWFLFGRIEAPNVFVPVASTDFSFMKSNKFPLKLQREYDIGMHQAVKEWIPVEKLLIIAGEVCYNEDYFNHHHQEKCPSMRIFKKVKRNVRGTIETELDALKST